MAFQTSVTKFPVVDIRKNAAGAWDLIHFTGGTAESITVPSSADSDGFYAVQLFELPAKANTSNSNAAPTITGLTEVQSTAPNAGEFYVNYNTGVLIFNSAEADNTYDVDYWGKGQVIKASEINAVYNNVNPEFTDYVRVSGQSEPTSGSGMTLLFSAGSGGIIKSYDYTNTVYRNLDFDAQNFLFNASSNATALQIDNNGVVTFDTDVLHVDATSDAVNIGGTTSDATAVFNVNSTTKGVLIPRMTTTERDAITTPTTSLLIFNTTDNEYQYFDGISWASIGGGGSTVDVNQTAHGFSIGDVIRISGADTYTLAQADTLANAEVVGMVSDIADVDNFTYTTNGYVEGLSGLTAGEVYFLDPGVAGAITVTRPTGVDEIVKPLLVATSTTDVVFLNFRGNEVTDSNLSFYQAFGDADLVSGVISFNHGFGAQFVQVQVYDNNDRLILPDEVTAVDLNNVEVDLSSYGTITGTWHVTIMNQGSTETTAGLWTQNGTDIYYTQGNVGIGTSTPDSQFEIFRTVYGLRFGADFLSTPATSDNSYIGTSRGGGTGFFANSGGLFLMARNAQDTSSEIAFFTRENERARLNHNGDLMVGTTEPVPSFSNVSGASLNQNGLVTASRDQGIAGEFNRITDEGDIVRISRDGTDIGTLKSSILNGNQVFTIGSLNGRGITLGEDGSPVTSYFRSAVTNGNAFLVRSDVGSVFTEQCIIKGDGDLENTNGRYGRLDDTDTYMEMPAADTVAFVNGGDETVRIESDGVLALSDADANGWSSIQSKIQFEYGNQTIAGWVGGNADGQFSIGTPAGFTAPISFYTDNTERMRIANTGDILVGHAEFNLGDNTSGGNTGLLVTPDGLLQLARQDDRLIQINRLGTDGTLVQFDQDGSTEGTISVNGTTVSYNGAHLSRWSQWATGMTPTKTEVDSRDNIERPKCLRGTVLSNVDEECFWEGEDNEQLNRTKVSDVAGDRNWAGVFQNYDYDDENSPHDFYVARKGDFLVRIANGVAVQMGDLLESAGDGTACPQLNQDAFLPGTLAKVTMTSQRYVYDDGSWLCAVEMF